MNNIAGNKDQNGDWVELRQLILAELNRLSNGVESIIALINEQNIKIISLAEWRVNHEISHKTLKENCETCNDEVKKISISKYIAYGIMITVGFLFSSGIIFYLIKGKI
jgi:hypothetical protein